MTLTALLIGGIAPAVLLGVATVLIRVGMDSGAEIPIYLVIVGLSIAAAGGIACLVTGETSANAKAIAFAIAMGVTWAAATACISYGFGPLKLPVSVVAPLTNSNALIAVLIGALAFGEWRDLNMIYAIGGTLLICAGATLVSLAK